MIKNNTRVHQIILIKLLFIISFNRSKCFNLQLTNKYLQSRINQFECSTKQSIFCLLVIFNILFLLHMCPKEFFHFILLLYKYSLILSLFLNSFASSSNTALSLNCKDLMHNLNDTTIDTILIQSYLQCNSSILTESFTWDLISITNSKLISGCNFGTIDWSQSENLILNFNQKNKLKLKFENINIILDNSSNDNYVNSIQNIFNSDGLFEFRNVLMGIEMEDVDDASHFDIEFFNDVHFDNIISHASFLIHPKHLINNSTQVCLHIYLHYNLISANLIKARNMLYGTDLDMSTDTSDVMCQKLFNKHDRNNSHYINITIYVSLSFLVFSAALLCIYQCFVKKVQISFKIKDQYPTPVKNDQLVIKMQYPPRNAKSFNSRPSSSIAATNRRLRLSRESDIKISDLHFGCLIGKGNFSSVYAAKLLDRIVAVKIVKIKNESTLRNLLHNSSLLKRLRHPNIIKTFGYLQGLPISDIV